MCLNKIKVSEKFAIMKSIFQNYSQIKKIGFSNDLKLSQKQYNKLQLFLLTQSIILLMNKEESKIITSFFIEAKKVESQYKLNCAINKFVFYLLA